MERLLIKFTKNNGAKFISHLDTLRTLHRAFRRAELPISYSKGFNPHASISVAAPLSLGIESYAEYADVEIDIEMDSEAVKNSLNAALPKDIKIINVVRINGKMPASMAAVAYANYSIAFEGANNVELSDVENLICSIMESSEIMKMKRTKSGEKLVDIRPLIEEILIEKADKDLIKFSCTLKAGSNGSLGSEAMAELIKEFSEGKITGYPHLVREEIYAIVDNEKLPLDRYYSGM